MGLLKCADSKTEFQDYVDKHSDIFRNLSYDAAAVISEYCSIEITDEEISGKEVVDVCKAVEEIRKEGEDRGKIMAYMDMGVSMEEIAAKLKITLGEIKEIADEIGA